MVNLDDDSVIDAEIVDVHDLPVLYGGRYYRNREPQEPSKFRETQLDNLPARRCVAKKTNGEQCRRWAVKGATCCKMHGGAAPQVLAKARARIQNNADKISQKEIEFVFDEEIPASTRLNAAQDLLDRAGLKAPAEVVLSQGEKPWEQVFDGISTESRAESRASRGYTEDPSSDVAVSYPQDDELELADADLYTSAVGSQNEQPEQPYWPLNQDQSDEPTSRDGSPARESQKRPEESRAHHSTGEEAIHLAALARREQERLFGKPRELPPPKSIYG
jgi:hypothetical protein